MGPVQMLRTSLGDMVVNKALTAMAEAGKETIGRKRLLGTCKCKEIDLYFEHFSSRQ